jgi:hypothetical protein
MNVELSIGPATLELLRNSDGLKQRTPAATLCTELETVLEPTERRAVGTHATTITPTVHAEGDQLLDQGCSCEAQVICLSASRTGWRGEGPGVAPQNVMRVMLKAAEPTWREHVQQQRLAGALHVQEVDGILPRNDNPGPDDRRACHKRGCHHGFCSAHGAAASSS